MPLLPSAGDAIFGEPAHGQSLPTPTEFADQSTPSRQTILLPDEDLSIRFTAYRTDPIRNVIWWIGCIITLGALGLIGRWTPSIWVRFCGKEVAFEEARDGSWLVVETPYGDLHIIPLQIIPYPYPLSTVFPQALPLTSAASRDGSVRGVPVLSSSNNSSPVQPPIHAFNGQPTGGVGAAKDLIPDLEQGKTTWEETMGFLKIMEYRYTRFALEPGTGRWSMIR